MTHVSPLLRQAHLAHGLDAPLPRVLDIGKGTVLPLRGCFYSQDAPLQSLAILIGDVVTPVANLSWSRTDVFAEQCPAHDLSGNSLLRGFECVLLFLEAAADWEEVVTLSATLKNGETIERQLGRIWLRAGYDPMPTTVTWPGEGAGVAICMATFRPPIGLFYGQAPGDADFMALCDQDDVWRPDKIETLLAALRPNQQLIFSRARVMDEGGRVLVRDVLAPLPEQLHRPDDADG
jgi:hypothetical protein